MSEDYETPYPFVAVKSNGGTLDDEAFTCGWECAAIDSALANIAAAGGLTFSRYIRTAILGQIDLIAMNHGFRIVQSAPVTEENFDLEHFGAEHSNQWTFVTMTNLPPEMVGDNED